MAIFRGVGGSGDSSDSSFLDAVTAQAEAAEQSRLAAVNATNASVAAQISATQQASAASASATSASNSASSILNLTAATGNAGTQASYNASTGVLTIPRGDTGAAGSDANVTYTSVRDAGALMDAEIANPEHVKLFNSSDYLQNLVDDTTPQLGGSLDLNNNNITGLGTIAATEFTAGANGITSVGGIATTLGNVYGATLQSGGNTTVGGNVVVTGTVDGRDVATDGAKLDTLERVYRRRFAKHAYSFSTVLQYLTTTYTTISNEIRGHSTTGSENELDFQITASHYDINSANEFIFYVRVQAPYSGAEDTVNLGTVSDVSAMGSLKAFSVDGDVTKHLSPYCGMSTTSTGANAFSFNNNHAWFYNPITDKTVITTYAYQSNLPSNGDTLYLHPFDWESTGTYIIGDFYPIDAYNASGTVNIRRDHKIYLGYFKNTPVLEIFAKESTSSENIAINSVGGVLTQYQD